MSEGKKEKNYRQKNKQHHPASDGTVFTSLLTSIFFIVKFSHLLQGLNYFYHLLHIFLSEKHLFPIDNHTWNTHYFILIF